MSLIALNYVYAMPEDQMSLLSILKPSSAIRLIQLCTPREARHSLKRPTAPRKTPYRSSDDIEKLPTGQPRLHY